MNTYYVFVLPPVGTHKINADTYLSKVSLIKADSDLEAIVKYTDKHKKWLSDSERTCIESRQTSKLIDLEMAKIIVKQTYADAGLI